MEITFVKTRHNYDPYTDFFKLAELSGFPIIYVDQLDVSKDGVYILAPMNGEWKPHIDNQNGKVRNSHLILWNIERPDGQNGSVGQYAASNRELLYSRYFDEIWVSDPRLADDTHFRFVPLGSHVDLGVLSRSRNMLYDFAPMSYMVPRRQTILSQFKKIAPNAWPPSRNEILRKTKFGLNIHQDIHPYCEPLRYAIYFSHGIPIISEEINNKWNYADLIIFASYDDLSYVMRDCLQSDYSHFQQQGLKARTVMCNDFSFETNVKRAIRQNTKEVDWR